MTEELKHKIDKKRIPVFICIGSMRSMLDSVAPRIGSKLQDKGYKVIGTEDNPLMALNMTERITNEIVPLNDDLYQKIYIDCTIDKNNAHRKTFVIERPLRPGGHFNKNLPTLGEWFIAVNVHEHGSSMEEMSLKVLSPYYRAEDIKYLADLCTEEIISVLEGKDEKSI